MAILDGFYVFPKIPPRYAPATQFVDEAIKRNVLIIAHGLADNPFTMPGPFAEMARRFPKVNLIMAHTGYMWGAPIAIEASKKYKSLYLGTSCIPVMILRSGIDRIGVEKFIFESDSPRWDLHHAVRKLQKTARNERELELIMGGNMMRLLGMDG